MKPGSFMTAVIHSSSYFQDEDLIQTESKDKKFDGYRFYAGWDLFLQDHLRKAGGRL